MGNIRIENSKTKKIGLRMNKSLILLELNEINFEAVRLYLDEGLNLPAFQKIMDGYFITTTSECEYDLLEPWIQWPSIHTGKRYSDHKVFRLGDFVNSKEEQIFEKLEKSGLKIGAISAMNAVNRLEGPAYFIPDPWTSTSPDDSFFSTILHSSVAQVVNDNSQSKITFKSLLMLGLSYIYFVKFSKITSFMKYAIQSKGKSWKKALFLDMFLAEVHTKYIKQKKPNFATLFLNAGAHIQHHYFYNSKFCKKTDLQNPHWYINGSEDPFLDMLIVYDKILQDFFKNDSYDLIIATGLSQKIYERNKFYYRLRNHRKFLKKLEIDFSDVQPRMTRDFLIKFPSAAQAKRAEAQLSKLHLNGQKFFGEIDNRGSDLFVVLTYDREITPFCSIDEKGVSIRAQDFVSFVAIKNGEHQGKGFAYFSENLKVIAPPDNSNITEIHDCIQKYFA
jgi:hypothetical protein